MLHKLTNLLIFYPNPQVLAYQLLILSFLNSSWFLGIIQEGIFRRNGKVKQQQELVHFVKDKELSDIAALLESNAYSVHEVATVLKNLLAEMPEPLLVESYYPFHCSLASMKYFF